MVKDFQSDDHDRKLYTVTSLELNAIVNFELNKPIRYGSVMERGTM